MFRHALRVGTHRSSRSSSPWPSPACSRAVATLAVRNLEDRWRARDGGSAESCSICAWPGSPQSPKRERIGCVSTRTKPGTFARSRADNRNYVPLEPTDLPRGVRVLECSARGSAISFQPRGNAGTFGTLTLVGPDRHPREHRRRHGGPRDEYVQRRRREATHSTRAERSHRHLDREISRTTRVPVRLKRLWRLPFLESSAPHSPTHSHRRQGCGHRAPDWLRASEVALSVVEQIHALTRSRFLSTGSGIRAHMECRHPLQRSPRAPALPSRGALARPQGMRASLSKVSSGARR